MSCKSPVLLRDGNLQGGRTRALDGVTCLMVEQGLWALLPALLLAGCVAKPWANHLVVSLPTGIMGALHIPE